MRKGSLGQRDVLAFVKKHCETPCASLLRSILAVTPANCIAAEVGLEATPAVLLGRAAHLLQSHASHDDSHELARVLCYEAAKLKPWMSKELYPVIQVLQDESCLVQLIELVPSPCERLVLLHASMLKVHSLQIMKTLEVNRASLSIELVAKRLLAEVPHEAQKRALWCQLVKHAVVALVMAVTSNDLACSEAEQHDLVTALSELSAKDPSMTIVSLYAKSLRTCITITDPGPSSSTVDTRPSSITDDTGPTSSIPDDTGPTSSWTDVKSALSSSAGTGTPEECCSPTVEPEPEQDQESQAKLSVEAATVLMSQAGGSSLPTNEPDAQAAREHKNADTGVAPCAADEVGLETPLTQCDPKLSRSTASKPIGMLETNVVLGRQPQEAATQQEADTVTKWTSANSKPSSESWTELRKPPATSSITIKSTKRTKESWTNLLKPHVGKTVRCKNLEGVLKMNADGQTLEVQYTKGGMNEHGSFSSFEKEAGCGSKNAKKSIRFVESQLTLGQTAEQGQQAPCAPPQEEPNYVRGVDSRAQEQANVRQTPKLDARKIQELADASIRKAQELEAAQKAQQLENAQESDEAMKAQELADARMAQKLEELENSLKAQELADAELAQRLMQEDETQRQAQEEADLEFARTLQSSWTSYVSTTLPTSHQ